LAKDLHEVVQSHLTVLGPGPGPHVVAYSGGLDSASLLHLLAAMSTDNELDLLAVTVDHGLRAFEREVAVTTALCRQLGVRHEIVRLPLGLADRARRDGRSLAEMARNERYSELRRLANGGTLYLAHHLDDQAETVLLRLMRGAGVQGLAAMRPMSDDLRRPLLSVARGELDEYASSHQLPVVIDPTNESSKYLRNRVRHEFLPRLESLAEGSIASLARSAEVVADQAEALENLLATALSPYVEVSSDGLAVPLSALGAGSLRRVQLHWLMGQVLSQPPEARHVRAVERLVASEDGSVELSLPHGLIVRREYSTLHLITSGSTVGHPDAVALSSPGEVRWGEWLLRARIAAIPSDVSALPTDEVWFPKVVGLQLTVRGWRQGDRMQPFGMSGTRLLSDLLGESKVPRQQRPHLPVVEDESGRIIWVAGVRRCAKLLAQAGEEGLCLTCTRVESKA